MPPGWSSEGEAWWAVGSPPTRAPRSPPGLSAGLGPPERSCTQRLYGLRCCLGGFAESSSTFAMRLGLMERGRLTPNLPRWDHRRADQHDAPRSAGRFQEMIQKDFTEVLSRDPKMADVRWFLSLGDHLCRTQARCLPPLIEDFLERLLLSSACSMPSNSSLSSLGDSHRPVSSLQRHPVESSQPIQSRARCLPADSSVANVKSQCPMNT